MKKLLLVSLLSLSTQVMAEEKATPDELLPTEYCNTVEKAARQMMSIRQDKSMSLKQVLDVVTKDEVLRHIVLQAWGEPSYATEINQKRTIQEFSDDVYLQCLKDNRLIKNNK